MEKIDNCPVCGKDIFDGFLEVKDHFLTGEMFSIVQCRACCFRFVNPRPDIDEVGRYYQSEEYISHNASKNDLFSVIYRLVRRISIRGKISLVRKFCQGTRLLDYGCGTAEFLKYARLGGFEVTGIEPSETARKYAEDKNGIPVFRNFAELDSGGYKYDSITLWHVMEHVHDLNYLMMMIGQNLKPEGTLVIAVPNCQSADAAKYGSHWAAWDVPRHLYHFTEETLTKFVTERGYLLKAMIPQKFDAYYVSLLSEKYLKGKSNPISALWNGFTSNFKGRKKKYGHSSQIFVFKRENSALEAI